MTTNETPRVGRSKLITQLAARQGPGSNVVAVDIHLVTADFASALLGHLRNDRFKRRLSTLLRTQLQPPSSNRKRPGEIQPEIPERLRSALRAKADALGPRMANSLVRRELEAWINFATGMRIQKLNQRRKYLFPPKRREFRERGRALVLEGGPARFTLNAGTDNNRRAIYRLIAALDMNASEFFSALIERICARNG